MSYKNRLSELRLLPLSCYFELHDLLTLIILFQGNYNIELPIKLNEDARNTRQNELIAIYRSRTEKTDKILWGRSDELLSITSECTNIQLKHTDNRFYFICEQSTKVGEFVRSLWTC